VCPWNQKFHKKSNEPAFQPRWEIIHWSKNKWERLDKEGFRELFKDSAVKRTKFEGLKRNIFGNNNNK
jgi:epoxyqueuosine reductase